MQVDKQQWMNELTEWNIWNIKKKISFINTSA